MIQLYLLNQINAAVRSLVDCTSPEIHYDGVYARGSGLASPYVSHRRVDYGYSSVKDDVLIARSSRYGLLVSDCSLKILGERYNMAYLWGECVPPECPLVSRWMGGQVPRSLVEPLLALVQKVGLGALFEDERLLHVYVVTPVVAGWHYRQPVYEWAEPDEAKPAINIYKVEGEPVHRQGSLLVVREQAPWGSPELLCHRWFYNHTTVDDLAEPWKVEPSERAEMAAVAMAVGYKGLTMAATRLRGPCYVMAVDHVPIALDEGEYILLHPFPNKGVD